MKKVLQFMRQEWAIKPGYGEGAAVINKIALSEELGLMIDGVDIGTAPGSPEAAELRRAYRDGHLLLFRNVALSDEDQLNITRILGEPVVASNITGMAAIIQYVSNNRPDGILPVGELAFHHDHINHERPLRTALLFALEMPASGSVTRFRNMNAVLDRLPDDIRARAEKVRCLHSIGYKSNAATGRRLTSAQADDHGIQARTAWKSLIETDPLTGRPALWLNQSEYILEYEGVGVEEGQALLLTLWEGADAALDCVYDHHWQTGDLIVWNNSILSHARTAFQAEESRTLRRTSAF